jgi:hypothetical protein
MRAGFAVEDGVALHFRRTRLQRVVSSRRDGSAYRVEPADGGVVEKRLNAAYLGADTQAPPPQAATTATGSRRRHIARRPAARKTAATRAAGPEPLPA